MKKILSLVCVLALCVCAMAGCGAKDVKLTDVLEKINTTYDESNLTQLTDVNDLKTYYQIDTNDVKQFAAEINENTSEAAVEIVLVEAKDATAATNIQTKLQNRYNSIYSQYASYSAEQVAMVKSCKVTTDGNFVTMIVANDAAGMLDIFYSFIK